jgi:hypothetical protein
MNTQNSKQIVIKCILTIPCMSLGFDCSWTWVWKPLATYMRNGIICDLNAYEPFKIFVKFWL